MPRQDPLELSIEDELALAEPASDPAPDVAVGAHYGQPEDAAAILQMLEREGILDQGLVPSPGWSKAEREAGVRTWKAYAVLWTVAVVLAASGYVGWQQLIAYRHGRAAEFVQLSEEKAFAGDHADLVDAERHLRRAREQNPRDPRSQRMLLFVHAQRALEDGTFEPGFIRPTIARGEELGVEVSYLRAATAVLAAAEGDMTAARENLRAALEAGGEDPAILYVAGRLEQRLGQEGSVGHLAAAVSREPRLSAAALALAEVRADEGRGQEALVLVDAVLARRQGHLRARLWRTFHSADETDPDAALATLAGLQERAREHGAATDRVLLELTRARVLRRKGDEEAAGEAVGRAATAGATEPRLLALLASEARAVGELARAQVAATSAVSGAPTNSDFRKLLASVLLARRDGVRALRALAPLSMEDPEVLRLSARAALHVGAREALDKSAEALAAFVQREEHVSVEVRALYIRTQVALGRASHVLRQARMLARRSPGDVDAAVAWGEAALAVRDGRDAVDALSRAVLAAPNHPDSHFLLGRAQRLAGRIEQAEQSLRRAVDLAPGHTEALLALGRLLIDRGSYEEADRIYQQLAQQGGRAEAGSTVLLGRLGRVETLLGLGRTSDARLQIEAVRPQERELPVVRFAVALVKLAMGEPGEAVAQLRPLARSERASADVLALYGDALLASSEVEASRDAYDRALSIDRGSPEALLGRVRLAVHAETPREAHSFARRLRQSLSHRTRPPRMRAEMLLLNGRAYLQEGRRRRDQAREALRAAVAVDGAPAAVHFWLGEALSRDNSPESRGAYQRYLELAPEGRFAARARRAI